MSSRATPIVFLASAISVALLTLYTLSSGDTSSGDVDDASSQGRKADRYSRDEDWSPEVTKDTVAAALSQNGRANAALPLGDAPDQSPQAEVSLPALMTQALQLYQASPPPALLQTASAFASEAVDPLWSPSMEAEIFSFFGEMARMNGYQFSSLEVSCRTSMCRLLFTQRVSTSEPLDRLHPVVRALNQRIRAEFGTFHQGIFSVDPYGTATSLLYLPRRQESRSDMNAYGAAVQ